MSKKSQARAAAARQAVSYASLPPEPKTFLARWGTLLADCVIVCAALVAYHNSFSGPLIWDDQSAITDNATIKQLGNAISPPTTATTGGRPFLNLTFAVNYAFGGMNVWGYHTLNLLIHALAGLTLFGIVRRTLLRPPLVGRFGSVALPLALAVAVIWIVHPLQTEAVTYISQRAESLMGLFYLLTLYCFIRGVESSAPLGWQLFSALACLLGVMSKEIIITAPVIVFLYDRTFVAGSFREAWRRHWRYYLGLAGTWALLVPSLMSVHQRGAGFELGITWSRYALISCRAVSLYLKLVLWPHPLVFDYGTDVVHNTIGILPFVLVPVVLIAGVVIALWRWPMIGFAGAWFFMILAPTTSVVPVVLSPMAEHRMYLSLAAAITLVVLGLHSLIGRRSVIVFAALAIGLSALSVRRNKDYHSALAIWSDTVEKCPGSARAHYNLGVALMDLSRLPEAISQYEAALQINPDYANAHNNLGAALAKVPGQLSEAISHYETALRINPNYAIAHYNLGDALAKIPGQMPEAISHYETALRINPNLAEAHNGLGSVLAEIPGRLPEAISHYEAALRINPYLMDAHYNLGNILSNIPSRVPEAIAHYEAVLRINPDSAETHCNLGKILVTIPSRLPEAIAHLQTALRLKPDMAEAHQNLGVALSNIPGHITEAIAEHEAALRIEPDCFSAHYNLGMLLSKIPDRVPEAIVHFQAAVRIKPDYAEAHNALGAILATIKGRLPEAVSHFEAALRSKPDYVDAHFNLGIALAASVGRSAEAIPHFDAVLASNPNDWLTHYFLGKVLSNLPGRRQDAIIHLEMALRIKPDMEQARQLLNLLRAN
jgi:tetratricopeptide (TPR) repeat protein